MTGVCSLENVFIREQFVYCCVCMFEVIYNYIIVCKLQTLMICCTAVAHILVCCMTVVHILVCCMTVVHILVCCMTVVHIGLSCSCMSAGILCFHYTTRVIEVVLRQCYTHTSSNTNNGANTCCMLRYNMQLDHCTAVHLFSGV